MNISVLHINKKNSINPTIIDLPASKSIANRALVINAMAENIGDLENISEARDTQTMLRLLQNRESTWDVLDAGTTMRFLTAYAAVLPGTKILTGTRRMQERPIKILADSLKELGALIKYEINDGYPPIEVTGIEKQLTSHLKIPGNISSQYISALLMIAPKLPQGLVIELLGTVGSKPYIQMTLAVMKEFGVHATWKGHLITIKPQKYQSCQYKIEPDWSAASYWYSFVALSENAEITLKDLQDASIQGDRKIADFMDLLGVRTSFGANGAVLTKKNALSKVAFDFTDCPDLAQTIAVVCAIKGITCKMTGLQSLRIKETDRISALQTELSKFKAALIEHNDKSWTLEPHIDKIQLNDLRFETYHDHRMAMAFAPISTQAAIEIIDPSVVNKSYPGFWSDMALAGFTMSEL